MENSRKNGLLAIWADIEKAYDTRFRQWHNCQHLTERLSIKGFIAGYRYCGLEGAPDYYMFYDTYDSKVLGSEPYLHSVSNPTPWTKESLHYYRNTVRNIYSEIYTCGNKPNIVSPYIYLHRFGLPEEKTEEYLKIFQEEYLETFTELPGVFRGRLFETDKEISGISSDEKKLHNASQAKQPFLAMFEVYSLDEITEEICNQIESKCRILNDLENFTKEKYWLDSMLNAPESQ